MYLEDDVQVLGDISNNVLKWDLTGCNRDSAVLSYEMVNHLKKFNPNVRYGQYYGGCGGSIFRTKFILDHILNINLDEELNAYQPFNPNFDSDILFSYLILKYGGTVGGPPVEMCETFVSGYEQLVEKGIVKIVHKYQSLYDVPLTKDDHITLGWD